jgi:23S rRNA pseudouridine1911/1915/1917 synthase
MQPFKILFEDNDLLVINKPAGVVVNDASSVRGVTIQQWMQEYLLACNEVPEAEWQSMVPTDFDDQYGTPTTIFLERLGMVHRLDKNTSGALVLAKHPGSLVNLLAQFRDRQVQKEYTCLVHGYVSPTHGVIDAPIGRSSKDRKKFAVVPDGRTAQTEYQVNQVFTHLDPVKLADKIGERAPELLQRSQSLYQGFSLVRCFPKTGRTHQIRVHFAHVNHPLVGDTTYVGKKRQKVDPVWCERHFLHASSITVQHPRTKQPLTVTAPLTEDLAAVQAVLEA